MKDNEITIHIGEGANATEIKVITNTDKPDNIKNGLMRFEFDQIGRISALNTAFVGLGLDDVKDVVHWTAVQGLSTIDKIIYDELLKKEMVKVNSVLYVELVHVNNLNQPIKTVGE